MRKSGILVVLFLLLTSSVFAQDVQPFELDEEATLMAATPEELETVIVTFISSDGELKSLRLQVLKERASEQPQNREVVATTTAPRRVPVVTTTPSEPPPVAPIGAVVLYLPEASCTPHIETITLPDQEKVKCLTREARLAINRMKVAPGNESPCWSFFGTMYDNCLDVPARKPLGVSYGMSPRFVRGLLLGQPWSGCAAGISGDPIFVSLHDTGRVLSLVAWESANEQLWEILDRADITDGSLVGQATREALVACGVVR